MRAFCILLGLGLVVGCSKDPEEGTGSLGPGGSHGDSTTTGDSSSSGDGSSTTGVADGSGDGSTTTGDDTTTSDGDGGSSSSTGVACEPVMQYVDADFDGYGDSTLEMQEGCVGEEGLAQVADDCDDTDPEVNPGMDELCDEKDNDCDQQLDEWSAQNDECNGCTLFMYFSNVYWVCNDYDVTWFVADEACQDFGAHLTSVQNAAEHNRIASELISSDNTWLGLNDQVNEGTFVWSDGSEFVYENWNSGEPNNDGGTEHCAEFDRTSNSFRWNDNDCDLTRPFVCKAPLEP